MNKKHLFTLTLILVVLGVLVTLKQSRQPAEVVKEEFTSLDLSFDPASVAKIVISKKDETGKVEILKQNEQWTLPGFFNARANREKIDTLLKEIREAKGEQRAKSKSVFKDFGIDDEEALGILLSNAAGAEVLFFKIGSKKADFGSVFVRRSNQETVYLTQANLLSAVGIYGDLKTENPKKDFWAATDFLQVDPARAISLKIARYPGGKEQVTTHVQRPQPGETWKSVPGSVFPLNSEKVRAFFENAKTWTAQEALDPKAQDYGFPKPFWTLEAGLDGGGSVKVTISHPKDTDYFAEVTGEPVVFKLPEYLVKAMDTDESKFFVDDPFGAEADQIEKLAVRADKKEWSFQPKLKKWEGLTNYLNDLKNFRINRLILDPVEAKKAAGPYQLEIQKAGEPAKILQAGGPTGAENKEYAAQIQGAGPAFTIGEDVFKQLFENLDRLKEPEPAVIASPEGAKQSQIS